MSKTFRQLSEASGELLTGYLTSSGKQYLRGYFQKISSSNQPSLLKGLQAIEDGLRNFGYSLGMDFSGNNLEVNPNSGDENFFIYEFSSGDLVQNAFLSVAWNYESNASFNKNTANGQYGIATPVCFKVELCDADVEAVRKLSSIPPEDEADLDIDG